MLESLPRFASFSADSNLGQANETSGVDQERRDGDENQTRWDGRIDD